MHTDNNSIARIITKYFDVSMKSKDFDELFEQTVLHFAGATTAFEYQKWLHCKMHLAFDTGHKPLSGKDFRLKLDGMGYFILNIKLFVQHVLATRGAQSNDAVFKRLARDFQIDTWDHKRIRELLGKRKFREQLGGIRHKHVSMTLSEVNMLWNHIGPEIKKKARVVARRRLYFIAKSQNIELSDLCDDLLGAAVRAFYKCLPTTKGISYITNYVKRSVENYAINTIESETTEKRGRLICTGVDVQGVRQFSMLVSSANQISTMVDADGNQLDVADLIGDDGRHAQQVEAAVLVRQIMQTVKAGSKGSTYLMLLAGEPNARFTSWLHANRILPTALDNTDLEDVVPANKMHQLISQFLAVEPERAERFIKRIRRQAAGLTM